MFWIYPAVLDFYYINLAPYTEIIENHRVNIFGTGIGGTQIQTLILIETTGLSYFTLKSAPFLLLPLFFMLVSIFRSLIEDPYSVFLTISILLPFASPGLFVLGCHELGFVLYLTFILTIILNYKKSLDWCSTSIIGITVIVCINFISYKNDALIILFLLFFCVLLMLMRIKERRNLPLKHAYMPLIGLIMAFGLNTYFYSTFTPYLEQSEFENMGIFKIVSIGSSANLLGDYLHKTPDCLLYIGILRNILIITVLGAILVIIIWRTMRRIDPTYLDLIFLSALFAGASILTIYTILGTSTIFYVVFSGYLGICLLNKYLKASFNWSKAIIYILLLLGLIYMIAIVGSGYYMGHKGPDEFQYLAFPTLWLGNHIEEDSNQHIKSDVLTIGYISYHSPKQDILVNYPKTYFTVDEATQLIQQNSQKKSTHNTYFVLNNKLHYFAIERWYHIKSLSNYRFDIQKSHNFDILYSTGFVNIAS